MKKLFLILFISTLILYSKECSPYFNPQKFYDSPDYLNKILSKTDINKQKIIFTIIQKELYKFTQNDIANEINNNFGGFWNDWIEDGYEMQLTPEDTQFRYKNHYLSMEVLIYGVVDDATKLKGTVVKYKFYNYTKEVNKYIACKKGSLL
jgi:hypothetical protein